jgi:hypothetical protein
MFALVKRRIGFLFQAGSAGGRFRACFWPAVHSGAAWERAVRSEEIGDVGRAVYFLP